jgi:diguanylate cyclase (GGDEF)-like protein/PAS domain S-box-containing protein
MNCSCAHCDSAPRAADATFAGRQCDAQPAHAAQAKLRDGVVNGASHVNVWEGSKAMTQADRTAAILNSIGDAVLSVDVDGTITYLNGAAESMTGWSREAAAGRPLGDVFRIIDGATGASARDPLSLAMCLGTTVALTPNCVLVRRDGIETEIEDSAAPIHNPDGSIAGAVIVFRGVGTALERSRQMARLAQYDALTGLPNRLLLSDRLASSLELARRHRAPLAVLFVDIDGFKAVNDSLGHMAGDRLLRTVAAALGSALRRSDTVSRYGGDEFVIVLSELEKAEDAAAVAKKLHRAVAGPFPIDGQQVVVSASIGLAQYPDHGQDADALIAYADAAMYRAKREGRGHDRLADGRRRISSLRPVGRPSPAWASRPESVMSGEAADARLLMPLEGAMTYALRRVGDAFAKLRRGSA